MRVLSRILIGLILLILLSLAVLSIEKEDVFGGAELESPSDWIKQDQINVLQDQVILKINNPLWARFTNTNSMDPFIDETSHAIEILPDHPHQVKPGDVISYHSPYGTLIHRVIETGTDKNGPYYIVKGDNNRFKDPQKVRFEDLRGVVVAVIY